MASNLKEWLDFAIADWAVGMLKGSFTPWGRVVHVGFALCAALLALPAVTGAQEPPAGGEQTRSQIVQAARERKRAEIAPYDPGRIEKWLYRIEDRYLPGRIFNPRDGLFARLGGLPQGAGFSAGPAYRFTARPLVLTGSAVHSIRGYWEADANARVELLPEWSGALIVGVKRRDLPHEDFFGLGQDSSETSRSTYRLSDTIGYAGLAMSPAKWIDVELFGERRDLEMGRGKDPRLPSVHDVFSSSSLPGLLEAPNFATGGARLVLDYADRRLGPPDGGEYRFEWTRTRDIGADQFAFDRFSVDLRQYVALVPGARTIVARVYMRSVTPAAGREVPFYYLPTLGGSNTLRGLPSWRLRDRHAVLGQLEYRFEVNDFLTGAFFYDTGRVASTRDGLFRGRFEQDGGFGLRFGFSTQVFLRTELVYGSRGARVLVRFSDVF